MSPRELRLIFLLLIFLSKSLYTFSFCSRGLKQTPQATACDNCAAVCTTHDITEHNNNVFACLKTTFCDFSPKFDAPRNIDFHDTEHRRTTDPTIELVVNARFYPPNGRIDCKEEESTCIVADGARIKGTAAGAESAHTPAAKFLAWALVSVRAATSKQDRTMDRLSKKRPSTLR